MSWGPFRLQIMWQIVWQIVLLQSGLLSPDKITLNRLFFPK